MKSIILSVLIFSCAIADASASIAIKSVIPLKDSDYEKGGFKTKEHSVPAWLTKKNADQYRKILAQENDRAQIRSAREKRAKEKCSAEDKAQYKKLCEAYRKKYNPNKNVISSAEFVCQNNALIGVVAGKTIYYFSPVGFNISAFLDKCIPLSGYSKTTDALLSDGLTRMRQVADGSVRSLLKKKSVSNMSYKLTDSFHPKGLYTLCQRSIAKVARHYKRGKPLPFFVLAEGNSASNSSVSQAAQSPSEPTEGSFYNIPGVVPSTDSSEAKGT